MVLPQADGVPLATHCSSQAHLSPPRSAAAAASTEWAWKGLQQAACVVVVTPVETPTLQDRMGVMEGCTNIQTQKSGGRSSGERVLAACQAAMSQTQLCRNRAK